MTAIGALIGLSLSILLIIRKLSDIQSDYRSDSWRVVGRTIFE